MNYYDIPCTNPWWNMAFDEWLLQNGPDEPVFRLWRNEPSVIIGHNQVAAQEVNLEYLQQHGIKLARRVTGGGAVYHDLQNMNYSFAGLAGTVSPEVFAEALRQLGVSAELSGRNDIFVEGRKISGYARSVWHNRELVHGTLMYNVDIDTLTAALNVEGSSKLNLKGVASVRSRVTNVRDYLPQFSSLDELQSALQNLLADTPVLADGSRQKWPKMLATPISDPGFPSKMAENAGNPRRTVRISPSAPLSG